MKTPSPTWECEYKHDRRAHRHRCAGCNKVLNAGDRALMCSMRRGTRAAHTACADKPFGEGGWLLRDVMEAWGIETLISQGFNLERHPLSFAGCGPKPQT